MSTRVAKPHKSSTIRRRLLQIEKTLGNIETETRGVRSQIASLTDEGQRFAACEVNLNRALNRIEALEIRIGKLFQRRLKTNVRADVI